MFYSFDSKRRHRRRRCRHCRRRCRHCRRRCRRCRRRRLETKNVRCLFPR